MLSTDKIKRVKKILFFLVFMAALGTAVTVFANPPANVPPGLKEQIKPVPKPATNGLIYIAAALCVGFSSLAAGWAVSTVGAAAMGAISEKPELAGRALIFVGLAEGIAIYGLIVAIMLLGKA